MNHSAKMQEGHAAQGGFTLIELMIVVAVVAILAAIAFPSYQEHVRKSRRASAKTALLDIASREERYYTLNNSYTSLPGNLGVAAFPAPVPADTASPYYNVSVVAADATSYSLQAVPTGPQAADDCGTYTLNQLGVQGITGNSASMSAATCWH